MNNTDLLENELYAYKVQQLYATMVPQPGRDFNFFAVTPCMVSQPNNGDKNGSEYAHE